MKSRTDEATEKVKNTPWAPTAEIAMSSAGAVFNAVGTVVPGVGVVGGALNMGSSMLNPKAKLADLKKQTDELKEGMENTCNSVTTAVESATKEVRTAVESANLDVRTALEDNDKRQSEEMRAGFDSMNHNLFNMIRSHFYNRTSVNTSGQVG